MSSYQRLKDGTITNVTDPERGVWYAASMKCGYWTDDWSKLGSNSGIPACPHCSCVGMQTTAADWFNVSADFLKTNPHYEEWLPTSKEHCGRTDNVEFMQLYELWVSNRKGE